MKTEDIEKFRLADGKENGVPIKESALLDLLYKQVELNQELSGKVQTLERELEDLRSDVRCLYKRADGEY